MTEHSKEKVTSIYNNENISHLVSEIDIVDKKCQTLVYKILFEMSALLKEARAKEYLLHGVGRRLRIINRCLKNIFSIFPPNRERLLNSEELADLNINLHAFFINVYGVLDNLAWVMIYENKKYAEIKKRDIGLFNKKMKQLYSKEFREYLHSASMKRWSKKHLINYRDALSHRIPLYVPPKTLTPEQIQLGKEIDEKIKKSIELDDFDLADKLSNEKEALGSVAPFFTHSFTENGFYTNIHFQILADFNTIDEIIKKYCEMFIPAKRSEGEVATWRKLVNAMSPRWIYRLFTTHWMKCSGLFN
jgi:hypothetical protein